MRFVSGWRLALRLAWREARRSKARSVLMLVMVTFPVVAVIGADVAQATSSVSSVEGLDRRIGTADARITWSPGRTHVAQLADPDAGATWSDSRHAPTSPFSKVMDALGGPRPATEVRSRAVGVRTDLGVLRVDATGLDLRSPLTRGLYRLTSGRAPTTPGEVAVNAALGQHGITVGDRLTLTSGRTLTVVGTLESTGLRTQPVVVGTLDLLPPPGHGMQTWLVGGGPVQWRQVLAANAAGAMVLSRAVIEHPPPTEELAPRVRYGFSSGESQVVTVLALVGTMVLLEVVLLAGPAFAVGARRQSRSLALIAANGGTPTQSRRVILGTAVVIGIFSAIVGIVLGIALGRGLVPVLQSHADSYFGPFQIRWTHVLGVATFGLVSAFLAAVVPAWIASRQDVVAVLAGRRGDRAASRRSPVIGLVLVAAGVGLAVLGARRDSGDTLIAGAAVLTVLGMIFLVPVVVLAVARLGRRLPLPLRYAVRDAARHRTRTVPAVAAVAATVAGAVALSIANTSDAEQSRAQYTPQLPIGMGMAFDYGHHRSFVPEAANALSAAHADPQVIGGAPPDHRRSTYAVVGRARRLPITVSPLLGAEELVADSMPPLLPEAMDVQERSAANAVLARGGVVLFSDGPSSLRSATFAAARDHGRRTRPGERVSLPAYVVDLGGAYSPALMVLSTEAAGRLSMPVQPVGVIFDGTRLSAHDLSGLEQAITALSPQGASVYVEHGFQTPSSEKIVLWILFGLAGVLMLGGTLTATFLALSDARPDLATLSAVGASPRMRRAVAAAYAVSVGVVGAVLGTAVGLVPGIAVSYPLTRPYNVGDPGPSHYLAIPWLEIVGLVVLLPLMTALVVGLLARSRLPLVARLD